MIHFTSTGYTYYRNSVRASDQTLNTIDITYCKHDRARPSKHYTKPYPGLYDKSLKSQNLVWQTPPQYAQCFFDKSMFTMYYVNIRYAQCFFDKSMFTMYYARCFFSVYKVPLCKRTRAKGFAVTV